MKIPPVIFVCSPLRNYSNGTYEQNIKKAKDYCRKLAKAGGNPVAPHLIYTQFLNDHTYEERDLGMTYALHLLPLVDYIFVFTDHGFVSSGMRGELSFIFQYFPEKSKNIVFIEDDAKFNQVLEWLKEGAYPGKVIGE